MNFFYKHYDYTYTGFYKNNEQVHIFYEYFVKINFSWLFIFKEHDFTYRINNCIQKFFNFNVNKSWVYENEDIHRLIDDKKLEIINKQINEDISNWCPPGMIIKNIKITHLVN